MYRIYRVYTNFCRFIHWKISEFSKTSEIWANHDRYGNNLCRFIHRNGGFYPPKQMISPQELAGLSVCITVLSTGMAGLSTEKAGLSTTWRP
jgi:hypothetical protein